ncbi:MAG: hypothetical protein V4592_08370 [Bacteroidota bacterium]
MAKFDRVIIWPAALSLVALLLVTVARGQSLIVTHVEGDVWCKGQLLKVRAHIGLRDTVRASSATAELGLLDPGHGRILLRFKNGRQVAEAKKKEPGVLYTLLVGDALEPYSGDKILTHKGAFDLVGFLTDTGHYGNPVKLMLIVGQGLPLSSASISVAPGDQFFLVPVVDTVHSQLLKRTTDSLFFPAVLNAQWSYLLKVRYLFQGRASERYFPAQLRVRTVNAVQVKELVLAFTEQLNGYYQGDVNRMAGDIYQELAAVYGNFYPDGVDRFIPGLR